MNVLKTGLHHQQGAQPVNIKRKQQVRMHPVKEAGASSPETGNLKTISEISPLPKSGNKEENNHICHNSDLLSLRKFPSG
jgi:hypothetical protein